MSGNDGGTVTLAWIHPGSVSAVFADSLRNLRLWDLCNLRQIAASAGEIHMQCARGLPMDSRVTTRNAVVAGFLKDSAADWMLWLDADMGFHHETLSRLLASADAVERPIVGALCFGGARLGQSSFGGHRSYAVPTIYDAVEDETVAMFAPRFDYERGAVVECAATGSACILIHRRVFEAIRERWGATWYTQITHPKAGNTFGEDLSFCIRAREAGFPILVDTSVKTTHDKEWAFLDEEYFDAQQGSTPLKLDAEVPRFPNRAERRRLARAK